MSFDDLRIYISYFVWEYTSVIYNAHWSDATFWGIWSGVYTVCIYTSRVFPDSHFGSFYPQNFVLDPQKSWVMGKGPGWCIYDQSKINFIYLWLCILIYLKGKDYQTWAIVNPFPVKQIAADDILKFVWFFRENDLTLHVNCLPSRQFTCNFKPYFLWKIKIN